MEQLINELQESREKGLYTPKILALELCLNKLSDDKKYALFCCDTEHKTNDKLFCCDTEHKPDNKHDENTFTFEILITIFIEMIHYIFRYDTKKYTFENIDEIIDIVTNKIEILNYLTFVEKIDDDDAIDEIDDIYEKRYCRIVLRDYDKEIYKKYNISNENNYHMLLNGNNKMIYKNMKNIYAIMFLKGVLYKISFVKL